MTQGVEGWSFSSVKACGGGVRLDDDVSTMISASFGVLSEGQLLALNLSTHRGAVTSSYTYFVLLQLLSCSTFVQFQLLCCGTVSVLK